MNQIRISLFSSVYIFRHGVFTLCCPQSTYVISRQLKLVPGHNIYSPYRHILTGVIDCKFQCSFYVHIVLAFWAHTTTGLPASHWWSDIAHRHPPTHPPLYQCREDWAMTTHSHKSVPLTWPSVQSNNPLKQQAAHCPGESQSLSSSPNWIAPPASLQILVESNRQTCSNCDPHIYRSSFSDVCMGH